MSDACVAQLVRAVDRSLKDLSSNTSPFENVFFPEKDSKFFKFEFDLHLLRYNSLKLPTRTPVDSVSYLIRD